MTDSGAAGSRVPLLRVFAVALVFALLLAMTLGTGQAHANYTYKHLAKAEGTIVISLDKQDTPGISLCSRHSSKPAAVRLSKAGVVKAQVRAGNIDLIAKRVGTTVLTYRWNHVKHKVKIKVVKYRNPVTSFTIGSKQYKSRYARGTTVDFGAAKSKTCPGAVKVCAATNWKIKKMVVTGKSFDAKTLKNGSKLPKNTYVLAVTLRNKTTGCVETLNMFWDGFLDD